MESCSNNMSSEIINQIYFLICSVFTGIIITLVYDGIKIIREVIKHNGFFIALEDVLFWIFASLFLFMMLYRVNDGTVRWFSIAGSGVGMWIYKKAAGQYIVEIMSTIINKTLHLVFRFLSLVFSPIKWVVSKVFAVFRKIKKFIIIGNDKLRKKLTHDIKKVKIVLCKRQQRQHSMEEGSEKRRYESTSKSSLPGKKTTK